MHRVCKSELINDWDWNTHILVYSKRGCIRVKLNRVDRMAFSTWAEDSDHRSGSFNKPRRRSLPKASVRDPRCVTSNSFYSQLRIGISARSWGPGMCLVHLWGIPVMHSLAY